jgi:ElaA protein
MFRARSGILTAREQRLRADPQQPVNTPAGEPRSTWPRLLSTGMHRAGTSLRLHTAIGTEITAADLHDLLRLRVDVFVVEQECPYHEIDGRDLESTTEHLWYRDDHLVLACLRILDDSKGRRIGRVATRADQRGRRLASMLIGEAIARCGSVVTVLDAQSHLRHFYESFGYTVTGTEFVEDGIPHLPMSRQPTVATSTPAVEPKAVEPS